MARKLNIKDKNGTEVREGDTVRYLDERGNWKEGAVIDVGATLAIEDSEDSDDSSIPILLYKFAKNGHLR
ncbi:MAG: hypothetical protein DMF64_09605 [Acidobacteria bacterium]|nr:MAG: hypothetical protein DMF64_09605 [Acidobacteriota bacterium]